MSRPGRQVVDRRRDHGVQAQERLAAHGRDIRAVDAVIISHDHGDHIRHAGVYQRKFGIPIYVTPATLAAAAARCNLGKLSDVRSFRASDKIRFGDVLVHAIPTPHDGADGSVFVVEAGKKRIGVLTDLGHVFNDLSRIVASLDAVFLESNYDPDMLAAGLTRPISSSASGAARSPLKPRGRGTSPTCLGEKRLSGHVSRTSRKRTTTPI